MLKGKKVLITGATSGIGLLTASMLLERGAFPIITGRNETKLREASASLRGKYGVHKLDVTDEQQVALAFERITLEYGEIDVLINNAGFAWFEPISDAPLEHYEQMMDTNYMGMVRCTKAVLPHFMRRKQGHIVNIASIAGKIGSPKSTGYSATKHAVLGFTNALRMELEGTGIAVSAVNPGPIDTPFFNVADPSGTYVNNIKWFMMPPERVAKTVIKVIERRVPEVDLPRMAAIGIKLFQLFPRLSNRVAAKWLNKK
ncbi:SDR family NAD(P)-dependent oxidoreductase [Paenibacillus abyssi]|uniref:Oxidoreductase n=1 Tax=Paenibacillus abyssi TaxID=1340531 RepID=A0A917FSW4_9BACL|nr:SDR family oxidoreductase [Paenibacillus abyssi]GGF98982.1 oxidoreductase [Paenibacillus abyssi]